MTTGFMEFRHKEIIDVTDGMKIGFVDDVIFDTETKTIISIVVYGRCRFFGLFGRDEDMNISWDDIEIIGADTILVKSQSVKPNKRQQKVGYFEKLFQ